MKVGVGVQRTEEQGDGEVARPLKTRRETEATATRMSSLVSRLSTLTLWQRAVQKDRGDEAEQGPATKKGSRKSPVKLKVGIKPEISRQF